MADAKIKKIIGRVTKLNFFHVYTVNMSFNLETVYNSSNFIYIYHFSEVM